MRAVGLQSGKLVEVLVPRLGVYEKAGGDYSEIKENTALTLVAPDNKDVEALEAGWYVQNGDEPSLLLVGNTLELKKNPAVVTGPWP